MILGYYEISEKNVSAIPDFDVGSIRSYRQDIETHDMLFMKLQFFYPFQVYVFSNFFFFFTALCNIITQYKPTKCTLSKLMFNF